MVLKSHLITLRHFYLWSFVMLKKRRKTNKTKTKQIINHKKENGPANRLMGTRCNATMLTRLIATKHRVQLRLMRALFVWQLNVTHPILLQPRSACRRKLGLSASLATQPSSDSTPGSVKTNELFYSNMIAGFLNMLDFNLCIWLCGFRILVFVAHFPITLPYSHSVTTGNFTGRYKLWPLRWWGQARLLGEKITFENISILKWWVVQWKPHFHFKT